MIDRRTEWSIWMVYSKVAMPHQNMIDAVEGTSMSHGVHRSSILTRRFTDDVIIYYLIFISSVVLWIFFTGSFSSNMLCSFFFNSAYSKCNNACRTSQAGNITNEGKTI